MEIDWRKVAVSLNGDGWRDLETAGNQESPETALEFRIRAFLLMSLANALFEGLGERH
jgi:hypothetical protein